MPELLKENDLPISYEIRVNGSVLSGEVEIISIAVNWEINRIANASIKISDGGVFGLENESFSNSASANFIPGVVIEIEMGFGDVRTLSFKGIIVSQRLVVRKDTSYLLVSCKNKAFKMTKSRSTLVKQNTADSDLLTQLISATGLTPVINSISPYPYPLFQYNSSDWDYLVIRSEANNSFVVTDNNDQVIVTSYESIDSPKYTIQADLTALDVDLELNGENTFSEANFTSWDPKTQAKISVSTTASDTTDFGNLKAEDLASSLDIPTLKKITSAPVSSEELTKYSKTWVNKAILSKIQGKITITGTNQIKPGDLVELKNFSARFDGAAFVSKIEQECYDGDWITKLTIGLPPRWHSSYPDVQEEAGLGLLPGIKGSQLAKVKKIDADPDSEYRVLVELGAFQNDSNSNELWARLAFNYASSQAGFFFFPEIGDEVLLSFINGDPRFPVIVGSLYSSSLAPQLVPDDKNSQKAIHTKSNIALLFNDKDKILTIKTPGGNSIELSDKEKVISLKDCNSNEIIMSENGVKLSSPKDIVLEAQGNLKLKGIQGVSMEASGGDLTGKGMNVSLEAQVSLKAVGTASAEFSASGQTTVKGAMVMIN